MNDEQTAGLDRTGLDQILTCQLLVAWAGEADTDPPRLGWWRTAMCDEFGGIDLLQRLLPHTWRWGVLESVRLAARRVEDRVRNRTADASRLVSLFRLGFALDERLDDHLAMLKREGRTPMEALPGLKPIEHAWREATFDAWLRDMPEVHHTASTTGRRIKRAMPADPVTAARVLCAGMRPLGGDYPMPHFWIAI